MLVATAAQTRTLLRGCLAVFLGHRLAAALALLAAVLAGLIIAPHDVAWLRAVHVWHGDGETTARDLAWYLGTFGDYPTYNVPFALLIWLYGVRTRRGHWRRVAIVCLLGATFAGLFDDCFRLTLGRARPDTDPAGHFYGPSHAFSGGFQSFPSGHAASTFGAAAALLLVDVPLGVLATCIAAGVVWARMELDRHFPSDVAVGAIVGLYFGLLVGFAARAPRRRQGPLS